MVPSSYQARSLPSATGRIACTGIIMGLGIMALMSQVSHENLADRRRLVGGEGTHFQKDINDVFCDFVSRDNRNIGRNEDGNCNYATISSI